MLQERTKPVLEQTVHHFLLPEGEREGERNLDGDPGQA